MIFTVLWNYYRLALAGAIINMRLLLRSYFKAYSQCEMSFRGQRRISDRQQVADFLVVTFGTK